MPKSPTKTLTEGIDVMDLKAIALTNMKDPHQEMKELEVWLGPHLAKAVVDHFIYLVVLKSGDQFLFENADYEPGSRWITLHPFEGSAAECFGHECPRGVQVSLDDISCVADAPDGS